MIEVRIQHPDGRVSPRVIDKGSFFIGREAACEVPLEDHVISRRHVRVSRDKDGGLLIEDLKSKNGTTLNDQPIPPGEPVPVREGDRIGVGPCTLVFARPSDHLG
jgi:pSer/pThr/pTyr-binding forkhead associated (FHA) protein